MLFLRMLCFVACFSFVFVHCFPHRSSEDRQFCRQEAPAGCLQEYRVLWVSTKSSAAYIYIHTTLFESTAFMAAILCRSMVFSSQNNIIVHIFVLHNKCINLYDEAELLQKVLLGTHLNLNLCYASLMRVPLFKEICSRDLSCILSSYCCCLL